VNILLAEDDRNLGSIIKNELEEEAYNIDLVYDGVEAVLRFIDKSYNFILLDITMPKLDGINTLRIIKRLNPDVPVIAFSGNAALHQREATCREGAIKFLPKPFLIKELKDLINRYKSK
jgi:DNA-binding response OmpR family regulator